MKLVWYAISDELLFEDEEFKKIIGQYKLELRDNTIGYESSK